MSATAPPPESTRAHFAGLQRDWAYQPRAQRQSVLVEEDPSRFRLKRQSRFTEDILNACTSGVAVQVISSEDNPEENNGGSTKHTKRGGLVAAIKARLLSLGHYIKQFMRRSNRRQDTDCEEAIALNRQDEESEEVPELTTTYRSTYDHIEMLQEQGFQFRIPAAKR